LRKSCCHRRECLPERRLSPSGFYFAKLWYYERLYPQIFTVAALSRMARIYSNSTHYPSE